MEHRRVKGCGKLLRNDRGVCQPAEAKPVSREGSVDGRALRAKEHRNGGREVPQKNSE